VTEDRRPSASPVCYADEAGIDPAYMWAGPTPVGRVRVRRAADSLAPGHGVLRPARPVYATHEAAYCAAAILAGLVAEVGG
jgi:hypothetical protein